MEISEALDRELIIERAEAIRLWLLGLNLSNRASSAIQRELGAIIDNDPGTYIDGQRPLVGLTVADFIAELHRPNGGAVGRVKSVGFAVLNELRVRIPAGASAHSSAPEPEYSAPEPEYTVPELDDPPAPVAPSADVAAAPEVTQPLPARRRGRPKGSTNAARRHSNPAPQRNEVPALPAAAPAPTSDDSMLSQIARLWPELHPHARRAVVMYASELWAEAELKRR